MPVLARLALCASMLPACAAAASLNLPAVTCEKYENEVLPAALPGSDVDSIDLVMWLFGYAVAQSGKHVLYPDALAPFGFALDNECKSNPAESLLAALAIVKPESKSPMDLAHVECGSFAARHAEFARSDQQSANTIMMWLFGFSIAQRGGKVFDAAARPQFETALLAECAKQPKSTLYDALMGLKRKPTARTPR